ncbi:hypothetical protein [Dickeya phage Sucellus]|nr:hypothetical protein [Dickeya phage Sucellus]
MAVINTLITAKDDASKKIAEALKKVKDASKDAGEKIGEIGDKADNVVDIFTKMRHGGVTSFSDLREAANSLSTALGTTNSNVGKIVIGLAALSGVTIGVAAGMVAMVNSSSRYVNEMAQVSVASGVGIEYLQKLSATFAGTGLQMEKLGDINKDVLDHLGDGFRDGSGPADDMKKLGLSVQDYNKYLNQANGGIKALIHTFYELKGAGKNQAEIVNMMETLASDSSHMITILNKYGNEQEALNAINMKNVTVTRETVARYQEYDKSVKELSKSFSDFKANALLPVVEQLNSLLKVMNGDWSNTNFMKVFSVGSTDITSQFKELNTVMIAYEMVMERIRGKSLSKEAASNLTNMANQLQQDINDAVDSKGVAPEGGWVKDSDIEKLKLAKKQFGDWMTQLDLNNRNEQDKADANYNIQLKKLKDFNDKKVVSQREYNRAVEMINSNKQISDNDLINKKQNDYVQSQREQNLISEEEYQRRLHEIKFQYQTTQLDTNFQIETERLNYEHETKLLNEKEYQDKMLALQQSYEAKKGQIQAASVNVARQDTYKQQIADLTKYNNQMNVGVNAVNSFASAISSMAERGSAAWYVAMITQKAVMVAQAVMAANLAAAMAAAQTPGGIIAQTAAYEAALNLGLFSAAAIAATGIAEIAGAREKGGPVAGGKTYLVGERGPELFTAPGSGGQITNNRDLVSAMKDGSGYGVSNSEFNQVNNFNSSGMTADDVGLVKSMTESIFNKKISEYDRNNAKLNGRR